MASKTKRTWRVIDLITWTTGHFQKQGIGSARLDAELLLAHVLDIPRVQLYMRFNEALLPESLVAYRELVRRRAERIPLAYLVGRREFMGLSFHVDERVLIPRPETEVLVEIVEERTKSSSPAILDVGTGSGAIAISLARRKGWNVTALDVSADAMDGATPNAEAHGVADRLTFLQGDLFDPIPIGEQFDWILSNPPYIPDGVLPTLQPEIAHEPAIALAGGDDGLNIVRRLIRGAPEHLKPGGHLLVEIGHDQADRVCQLMQEDTHWSHWNLVRDYTRVDRFLFAQRIANRPHPNTSPVSDGRSSKSVV